MVRIDTICEDVTTEVLGTMGPWQRMVTLIACIYSMTYFFDYYDNVQYLTIQKDTVVCMSKEMFEVIENSSCLITNGTAIEPCEKWYVKLVGIFWMKKWWTLQCENQMAMISITIINRLGSAFGFVMFGLIADSFGRKKSLMMSVVLELPFRSVIVFCGSNSWFRLLLFVRSLFGSATGFVTLIIVCEIASNSWRLRLINIAAIPLELGHFFAIYIVNLSANVETYDFIGCVLGILVALPLLRFMPEVPQWLLYNHNQKAAELEMHKAAKKNGINLYKDFRIRPVNARAYIVLEQQTSCFNLINIYNAKVIIVMVFALWLCMSLIWGILCVNMLKYTQNAHNIVLYLTGFLFLIGSVDLLLLFKMKLKKMLVLNISLTGVATICILCIGVKYETLLIICMGMAATSGMVARLLIINITPRLFAINVRATLFGSSLAFGELGSALSVLLDLLEESRIVTLSVMVGFLTVTAQILCCLLHDVDGRELPDVAEDMDYFMEVSKPMRWATQRTNSPSLEELELIVHSYSSRDQQSTKSTTDREPAKPIAFKKIWQSIKRKMKREPKTRNPR